MTKHCLLLMLAGIAAVGGVAVAEPDVKVVGGAIAPLRIVAEHYPPYEFVRDGEVTGINVEVTALIMKRLGVPYTFSASYPFSRAWALIRSGNAEAEPSVSCQPHRQPYVYCTDEQRAFNETGRLSPDYLWITRYVFFVNRRYADSLKFDSYEQMRRDGCRVGIIKDYTYDGKLQKVGLDTTQFISYNDGLKALAKGSIDMLPMDKMVGRWAINEMGLRKDIVALPKVIFEKPYLMLFSRASEYPGLENVCKRYYAELRKIRNSGEYADIVNRYIVPDYPYPLPRPLVFVAEAWAPFESLRNDVPVGIDVDVLKRVMGRLNLPYEIQLYPWSRAWMLAERGRADAVLSVSYKASREDVLYYTPAQREFAATEVVPEDYLWLSKYVFFVKKNRADAVHFESYAQLKRDGYRVGTNKGYSYCDAFIAVKLSCREYPDTRSGLTALANGEIDLYPMDKTVGLAELEALGFSDTITLIPKVLFSKPYLAPFVRGSDMPENEALMHAFYDELHLLRRTGEYEAIVETYHSEPPKGE